MVRKISGPDADYVRRFKALAGDTSKECGYLSVRKGLFTRYQCRLCGETFPAKDAYMIDKLTGYCESCMSRLRDLDAAAFRERQAEIDSRSFTARVHGISFREKAVLSILVENYEFDMSKKEIKDEGLDGQKIFKYDSVTEPAKLVPEPDNPEDPNAIAVYVEDKHIGYIAKGMTKRIQNLIDGDKIESIQAEIGGGPYRVVYDDGTERDTMPFWCSLKITKKPDCQE